jgi:hypothetical protein
MINIHFLVNKVVSFQVVFVTNYEMGRSYAIFNYEYDVSWTEKYKSILMGYTDGTNPVKLMYSNSGNSNIDPYAVFSSTGNISKLPT